VESLKNDLVWKVFDRICKQFASDENSAMELNINDINQMLLFFELVSKCDDPELREPYEQVVKTHFGSIETFESTFLKQILEKSHNVF